MREPITRKLIPCFEGNKPLNLILLIFLMAGSSFPISANNSNTKEDLVLIIDGPDLVCPDEEATYTLVGAPTGSYLWTLNTGGSIISTGANGLTVTVDWSLGASGSGPHHLTATESSGGDSGGLEVFIHNISLSCENTLQVSLDQNGEAEITPEMLLVGNFPSYNGFTVELTDPLGNSFGNIATCDQINTTLIASVSSPCTSNSCWTDIHLEDKQGPQIDCPTTMITMGCDQNYNTYPAPDVTDNCDLNPSIVMIQENINNSNLCAGVTITRLWQAHDNAGNSSSICSQQMMMVTPDVADLPADVIWTCDEYDNNPNITDPTPFTGNLATTGSGTPGGIDGAFCNYGYYHTDDTLSSCGNGTKILRTWVVINWCTGAVITTDPDGDNNEQIIEVADIHAPTITTSPITLNATITGWVGVQCASTGFVPPAIVEDDCSQFTTSILTSVGEIEYANGVDGSAGGTIPFPGLTIGEHTIFYKAIDECGNESEVPTILNVVDDAPPWVICDAITDANITSNGMVEVFAETFDDGSSDNCCLGNMEVKRMGQPDVFFDESVTFSCFDAIEMVVLRVYDCFGNFNDCMVEVQVQDKLEPICIAPIPVETLCTDLPAGLDLSDGAQLEALFGGGGSFDNCNSFVYEVLPAISTLDGCGSGTITRTFLAEDGAGNTSSPCTQIINVDAESDWEINFPADWTGECGATEDAETLEIIQGGCDLLAVTVEEQHFNMSSDSTCFQIIRTYHIINWCSYNQNLDPIVIPHTAGGASITDATHNNYGYYTYAQWITVHDEVPPVITYNGQTSFCSLDENCENGTVSIPVNIDDACTDDLTLSYELDTYADGFVDGSGAGHFAGVLPLGVHSIKYFLVDGCGNETHKEIDFEIKDCKNPTPVCSNGLIVTIMGTGMIEVWAEDFDAGSYDNCDGELIFTFSSDTTHTSQVFDCDHTHEIQTVQVWVTDIYGNQDLCETFIDIQDFDWICEMGDPIIAGTIQNEENYGVEGVSVHLSGDGDDTYLTTGTGAFEFSNLQNGNDYSVTPEKDDNPMNGVTTFDMVIITKHILGEQLLDSPYKIIAADVNHSDNITTFDLVELRKIILQVNSSFPNNNSWRFVASDYEFPNPQNPWEENFPEVIGFNNIDADQLEANFVGVKIGDVNNSANFSGEELEDRNADGTLFFNVENIALEKDKIYTIPFRAENFTNIAGYQFTLNFSNDALEFVALLPNQFLKEENFGMSLLGEGAITSSWNAGTARSLDEDAVLFEIQFKAKKSINLENLLSINSRFTTAEAYNLKDDSDEYEFWNVSLFSTENAVSNSFELYQNIPNPFNNTTQIGFQMPSEGKAELRVYDMAGRTIFELANDYAKGYNEITLDKNNLGSEGLLYYELSTASHTATRKMLLIR